MMTERYKNYSEQYHLVSSEIDKYFKNANFKILKATATLFIKSPIKSVSLIFTLGKYIGDIEHRDANKELMEVLFEGKEATKYEEHLGSPDPVHIISKNILTDFPDIEPKKLKQYQESKIVSQGTIRKPLAVILAIGAFLTNSIPKEVIKLIEWDYEKFKVYTFIGTIALVGYLGLSLLPLLWHERKIKVRANQSKLIFDYISLIKN